MNDTAHIDFSSAGAVYLNSALQIQFLRVIGGTPDAAMYIRDGADLVTSTLVAGSTESPFGYVEQQGGRVRVINTFGLDSRYTVTGGEFRVEGFANIGGRGTALFEQQGGTVTLDREVSLGNFIDSDATFAIRGGTMNARGIRTSIGMTRYIQTGGNAGYSDTLRFGTTLPQFRSAFDVLGGSLSAGILHLGSNGAADVQWAGRGTVLSVSQQATFFDTAYLTVERGFELRMNDGGLFNESVFPERLSGMADLTIRYEGDGLGTLEVAGEDIGPLRSARDAPFAVGSLRIGVEHAGRLRLINQFTNRPNSEAPEALYVEHLEVGPASVFELSGYNVYAGSATIDPTAIVILGGGQLAVRRPTLASTAFSETSIGVSSYAPGPGDQELGFTTTYAPSSGAQPLAGVAFESGSLSPHFAHRSVQATTTFAAVPLDSVREATVALSIRVAATEYEAGDFIHAFLTDGSETLDLVNLHGASGGDPLEELAGDGFLLFTAELPASWHSAQLVVTSSSNSSTGAERFDFDGYGVFGIQVVPEPNGIVLAATAFLVLVAKTPRFLLHSYRERRT